MKRILSILLLCAAALSCAPAAETVITRNVGLNAQGKVNQAPGSLQFSDPAFSGFAGAGDARFPATLAAVPSRARAVWIAPDRAASAGAGKGTAEDPYDGSTAAKLDALLNSLPANIEIHLLPGTFQTQGNLAWQWKTGWIMRGAGIDLTTLQLAVAPAPAANAPVQYLGFGESNPGLARLEVHDLTWDGNLAAQPDGYSVVGNVYAASGGFWNLRLRNWGGKGNGLPVEQFGPTFTLADDGSHVGNATVTGCVVEPPVCHAPEGGASLLGINVYATTSAFKAAGVIENNVVTGTGTFQGEVGIATAGPIQGLRVSNNRVRLVVRGFHQDTVGSQGPSRNVDLNHNFFEDVSNGWTVGSMVDMFDYRFTDNVVALVGQVGTANGSTPNAGSFLQGSTRNALVARNRFTKSATTVPGQSFTNLSAFATGNAGGTNTNTWYVDNVVDPAISQNYPLQDGDETSTRRGNRFTNGQPVPVYTDTESGGGGSGGGSDSGHVSSLWDAVSDMEALVVMDDEVVVRPGYTLRNALSSGASGFDDEGLFGDGSRLKNTGQNIGADGLNWSNGTSIRSSAPGILNFVNVSGGNTYNANVNFGNVAASGEVRGASFTSADGTPLISGNESVTYIKNGNYVGKNGIAFTASAFGLRSDLAVAWYNTDPSGTLDAGLSRVGPGTIALSNGTPGDASGTLQAGNLTASGALTLNTPGNPGNFLYADGLNTRWVNNYYSYVGVRSTDDGNGYQPTLAVSSGASLSFYGGELTNSAADVRVTRSAANTIRLTNGGSGRGNMELGNLTASGDVEVTDATKGMILRSPDGTRYRLKVANGGALSTVAVP